MCRRALLTGFGGRFGPLLACVCFWFCVFCFLSLVSLSRCLGPRFSLPLQCLSLLAVLGGVCAPRCGVVVCGGPVACGGAGSAVSCRPRGWLPFVTAGRGARVAAAAASQLRGHGLCLVWLAWWALGALSAGSFFSGFLRLVHVHAHRLSPSPSPSLSPSLSQSSLHAFGHRCNPSTKKKKPHARPAKRRPGRRFARGREHRQAA